MGKTLAESAAEILAASTGRNQEPAQKFPVEVNDLGGATPTDDYSGPDMEGGHGHGQRDTDISVGVKAAAAVKVSPKPMAKKTPVATQAEETEENVDLASLTEEELDELLSTLSEEELEALEEELDLLDESMDTEDDEEDDEEGMRRRARRDGRGEEMNKPVMKKMSEEEVKALIKSNMGSVMEDIDALFNGESLSEEFHTKASTIYGAAVQSRVEAVVGKIMENNEAMVVEQVESIRAELSEQVDTYLNYVVEQWMEENQVAVESGIQAEVVESFMSGLKNLFAEHYIDVPADKADLVEEMASRVIALEEAAEAEAAEMVAIIEELNNAKKNESVRKICEGLTEVQINKMKSLAEGVEFTSEGEFNGKLAVIRENYFPTKKILSEVAAAEGTPEEPEVDVSGIMAHYVKAISKQLPK